jgi:outer membrane protein W
VPQGWSFDIGGDYTWVSFSTPSTSGSTGGVQGRLSYEKPNVIFGQARSVYNLGPLSSSSNKSKFYEWYTEFVGGYCFSPLENWVITPYVGIGLDYLSDHLTRHSSVSSIRLKYSIYYAIAGVETHYTWQNWMVGLKLDCLPTFDQYLKVKSLSGSAWTLKNRTGAAVQLPFAYRYVKNYWLEFAPYYRFLPIGAAHALGLPKRNLNEWGAFVNFRFFL